MNSKEELITSIMTMADSLDYGWNHRVCWDWMHIIRTIVYNDKPHFIHYSSNFYYFILMNKSAGKNIYEVIKPYIRLSDRARAKLLIFYKSP